MVKNESKWRIWMEGFRQKNTPIHAKIGKNRGILGWYLLKSTILGQNRAIDL